MKISRIIAAALAVTGLATAANAGTVSSTYNGATANLVTQTPAATGFSYSQLGVLGLPGSTVASITTGSPGVERYDASNNGGGELSVSQIAARWAFLLGGEGAVLTFTRIYDSAVGVTSSRPNIATAPLANATDQVWTDGTVSNVVVASYAYDTQYLSTSNVAGTSARSIAIKSGFALPYIDPSLAGAGVLPTGATPGNPQFIFARTSTSVATAPGSAPLPSSAQTSIGGDSDSIDNFISFVVRGIPGVDVAYALFVEDGVDADYNDLAVIFTGTNNISIPGVPLPAPVLMGAAALGLLGVRRARRA